jgi:hypothetical protein
VVDAEPPGQRECRGKLYMPDDWGVFFSPEFPVATPAPEELEGPSSSPVGNLAMLMLPNNAVGHDLIEILGLYLAADSRLNVWYAKGAGKAKPSGMELAAIRVFSADLVHLVYDAWKAFESESRNGFPVSEQTHGALLGALSSAVFEICSKMGETLDDFGHHEGH